VLAKNLLLKQQLLVLRWSRRRAPNFHAADRLLFGFCSMFLSRRRLLRTAVSLSSWPKTTDLGHGTSGEGWQRGWARLIFWSDHAPTAQVRSGPNLGSTLGEAIATGRRAPKVTVTRERVSLCQKGVTLWLLFMVN
jgi:hypothetical protein